MPQIIILEKNLRKILEAEAGKESSEISKGEANTLAFEATIKMLQGHTGRKEFNMNELLNPAETIRKYENGGNNIKSNSRSTSKGKASIR